MNVRLVSLATLMAIAACSSNPSPQSSAAVKDVATSDYLQYWRVRSDSFPQPTDIPHEDGCMRVQVVIDSEGKITDSKLLAVVGPELRAWIPKLLAQLRYDPAPGNAAKTPIRTVLPWTFNYSVNTETGSAATSAAAIKARVAAGPTPDDLAWTSKCKAEMDQQMGIAAAPSSATTH